MRPLIPLALLFVLCGSVAAQELNGIETRPFTDTLSDGKVCLGFTVVASPDLQFRALWVPHGTTPSRLYDSLARCGQHPLAVANAGFFNVRTREPLGLLVTGAKQLAVERQRMSRRTGDTLREVYPIHAAFGRMADGTYEAAWIYCVPDAGDRPFVYPFPYNNDDSTHTYAPAPPRPGYLGASLWSPVEAVGAGPMLVRGGRDVSREASMGELYYRSLGNRARHPRTAVGATADGRLIVVVADGRGQRGSAGYTLAELAARLLREGAVDGINLDGGGSSALVVGGRVLNRPSDTGRSDTIRERRVPTFVVISE